ncbi:MAG: hypothetical protein COS89_02705 [Deltaproteobacteria bacterium CG07_land_8_20_14_0_80_38_7]|nr:MAG: hypothetical protein COS89_02705 [Deltaproteobacteria bacterium CG07_land_8_20_14_0_80_38_7]
MRSFMKISKILVFSEESRSRVFVGTLIKTSKGYSFIYDHDYMSRASATALGPDLPFSLDEILSKKLFDSLYDLIPSRDNPAYEQYCRSVGINPDEDDPFILLAYLGKGPSNFVFEPAPNDALPTGKEVVQFREALGLSQRQFALLLDIPSPTLQTIEKETSEGTTARRLIQIFIENPSSLWKVIKQRGIYLHSKQLLSVEKYIRQKEQDIGSKALERQKKFRELAYIETYHKILFLEKEWNQKELLKAMEQAVCRNTGWPIGVVLHTESGRPVFRKDGVEIELESESESGDRYDEWYLKRNGSFYFFRTLEEDRRTFPKKSNFLYFDMRIWRIAEILLHCEKLYKTLGVDSNTEIEIEINHFGLSDRQLTASNQLRAFSMLERTCLENSVSWTKTMKLKEIEKNRLDYVIDASWKLFMLFDGWQPDVVAIEGVYNEFLKSQI